jgi:predicted small lipoprotein YifL
MSPSPSTDRRRALLALLGLLGLLALAGCGKKGELRLPTQEEIRQQQEDDDPSQEDGPA